MIEDKCKNCMALVIPHFSIWNTPNRKLPKDDKDGTCRCNVDAIDRLGRGYYGWCHPDKCRGAEHHYYFDYNTPNRDIKFID